MSTLDRRGFTLIELLTVVAIIAILASLTAVVAPRAIERAKLRKLDGAMIQLRTAFTEYYTKNSTYPPTYGYIAPQAKDKQTLVDSDYFTKPYLALMQLAKIADLYDNFADSTDTNRDGNLGILEYSPIGQTDVASNKTTYQPVLYNGSAPQDEIAEQLKADGRPIVYVPVNLAQFKRARQFWVETGDVYGATWNATDPRIAGMTFPPPTYDAYVLISVGPGGSTFGVVADPPSGAGNRNRYHLAALRTYFLATRDLNNNGKLDFEFEARSREDEGLPEYTPGGQTYSANNNLPDPIAPRGYGPVIRQSPK